MDYTDDIIIGENEIYELEDWITALYNEYNILVDTIPNARNRDEVTHIINSVQNLYDQANQQVVYIKTVNIKKLSTSLSKRLAKCQRLLYNIIINMSNFIQDSVSYLTEFQVNFGNRKCKNRNRNRMY